MKRFVSVVLCILFVVTSLPLSALADMQSERLAASNEVADVAAAPPSDAPDEGVPEETVTLADAPTEQTSPAPDPSPSEEEEAALKSDEASLATIAGEPTQGDSGEPADDPCALISGCTLAAGHDGECVSAEAAARLQTSLTAAAQALSEAVEQGAPADTVQEVTLTENVILSSDCTLTAGISLTISSGCTMTVQAGATLTIDERAALTLPDGAAFVNRGAFAVDGTFSQFGVYTGNAAILGETGEHILPEVVPCDDTVGCALPSGHDGPCASEQATARLQTSLNNAAQAITDAISQGNASFTQEITLSENVILTESCTVADGITLIVASDVTMTVQTGACLTVAERATLTLCDGATLVNRGDVLVNGRFSEYGSVFGAAIRFGEMGVLDIPQETIPVTAIEVVGNCTVGVGMYLQLAATALPTVATDRSLTWSIVSGSQYVSVDNGLLCGLSAGTAQVLVSANGGDGVTAAITVSVTAAASPSESIITQNLIDDGYATLSTDLTLTKDLVVRSGSSLQISDCRLQVGNGVTLYLDGSLSINGTLDIQSGGRVVMNEYGGSLTIDNGGAVRVYAGGALETASNVLLSNGGSLQIDAGGSFTNSANISMSNDTSLLAEDGAVCSFAANSRIWVTYYSIPYTPVTISGIPSAHISTNFYDISTEADLRSTIAASVYASSQIYVNADIELTEDLTVPAGISLRIAYNVTLQIPSGIRFENAGEIFVQGGSLLAAPGSIVVNNGSIRNVGSFGSGSIALDGTYSGNPVGYVPANAEQVSSFYCGNDADLAAALTSDAELIRIDTQASVTLADSVVLAAGRTLHCLGTLVIPSGCTLTNNGSINVQGCMNIAASGALVNEGSVYVVRLAMYRTGELIFAGQLTNNGILDVQGALTQSEGGVYAGARVRDRSDAVISEGIPKQSTRSEYDNLCEAIAEGRDNYGVYGDLVISSDTVLTDFRLSIQMGGSLTVPTGVTLQCNGGQLVIPPAPAHINGTLRLCGSNLTLESSTMEIGGSLIAEGTETSRASITVNTGELSVLAGGTLSLNAFSSLSLRGNFNTRAILRGTEGSIITVAPGAFSFFELSDLIGVDRSIFRVGTVDARTASTEAECIAALSDASPYETVAVALSGAVTLYHDVTVPKGYQLSIPDGARLTIPAGVTLCIENSMATVQAGGRLDVLSGGLVAVNSASLNVCGAVGNLPAGLLTLGGNLYVNGLCSVSGILESDGGKAYGNKITQMPGGTIADSIPHMTNGLAPTSIAITCATDTAYVGQPISLSATVGPENADYALSMITWAVTGGSSADAAQITPFGTLTCSQPGTVIVTASVGESGVTASKTLTFIEAENERIVLQDNIAKGFGDYTVQSSVTLPSGETCLPEMFNLFVPEGAQLTVPAGATLVVSKYACITVDGTMRVAGALVLEEGSLSVGESGSLQLQSDAALRCTGAYIDIAQGSTFSTADTVQIELDATTDIWLHDIDANYACFPAAQTSLLIEADAETDLRTYLADTTYKHISVTPTVPITLSRSLTVPRNRELSAYSSDVLLTIPSGVTLTIAADGSALFNNAVIAAGGSLVNQGSLSVCDKTNGLSIAGTLTNNGVIEAYYGRIVLDGGTFTGNAVRIGNESIISEGIETTLGNTAGALTGITLTAPTTRIPVGGSVQLTLRYEPADIENVGVHWYMPSGGEYASVDSSGLVTGLAPGAAYIVGQAHSTNMLQKGVVIQIDAPGAGIACTVSETSATLTRCLLSGNAVTIPDTYADLPVTAIASGALGADIWITELTLPASLQTVAANAINGIGRLETIVFSGDTPPTFALGWLVNVPLLTEIRVPFAQYPAYCAALQNAGLPDHVRITCAEATEAPIVRDGVLIYYGGSEETLEIPSGVTAIGDCAFRGVTSLTSVVLPEGLTSIGIDAFAGCTGLESLTIPSTVVRIGRNAFGGCTGIRSLTFLRLRPPVGCAAVGGMTALMEIRVPHGTVSAYRSAIGSAMPGTAAFRVDSESGDYTVVDGVLTAYAGEGGTIVIPDGVTAIASEVFRMNTTIASVTFPQGLLTIGQYAFCGCTNLRGTLDIPNSVTTIGECAFSQTPLLEAVSIGPNASDVAESAFLNSGVQKVTLGSLDILPAADNWLTAIIAKLAVIEVPAGKIAAFRRSMGTALCNVRVREIGSTESGDFVVHNGTLIGYGGPGGAITLPDGITAIGDYAFYGNTAITAVTIPASVTSIGEYAFAYCQRLGGDLTLPAGLLSIGDYAFASCAFTSGLTVPGSVQSIGSHAFFGISFNGLLALSDGLKTIGASAFENASFYPLSFSGTPQLVIPDTVTSIGERAFHRCGINGNLVLSEHLTTISAYAFSETSFSGALTIPDSVTTIADYAFYLSGNFSGQLTLSNRLETIGDYAFASTGISENLTIPATVTDIGAHAFSDCRNLNGTLTLSEGLVTIDEYAFSCTSLTGALSIPASVRTIGDYAFQQFSSDFGMPYSSFTEGLTLRDGLQTIGAEAFAYCSGFTGELTIPDSVTTIGCGAFRGCSGFTGGLTIPDAVAEISDYAFSGCSGFNSELTLSAGLISIGSFAFSGCNGFTNTALTIPAGLTSIGSAALPLPTSCTELTFLGASLPSGANELSLSQMRLIHVPRGKRAAFVAALGGLISPNTQIVVEQSAADFVIADGVLTDYQGEGGAVTIPVGVTAIGPSVFSGNTNLSSVVFHEGLLSIGDYAFEGCTNLLGSIVIPSTVVDIGSHAFDLCYRATSLSLGSGLLTIGDNAFRNCSQLGGTIRIPDQVQTIGDNAFYACYQATGLTLGSELTDIGSSAFAGCSSIAGTLVIPNGVTTISDGAFSGCAALTGITFGNATKRIESNAFAQCTGLVGAFTIPNTVTDLLPRAFRGCAFTEITVGSGVTNANFESGYPLSPFYECNATVSLTLLTETPPQYCDRWCTGMSALQTVRVPQGTYAAYAPLLLQTGGPRLTEVGASGDFLLDGTRLIAYFGADANVTVPDAVTEIGAYAFACNTTVTSVTLPSTLTAIGSHAFTGCSQLATAALPDDLETLGEYAFSDCSALSGDLAIPANVTVIPRYAFYNCGRLTGTLSFPAGLTRIEEGAFKECAALSGTLSIPDSVSYLGADAFYGCAGFTGDLTLPAGITAVPACAFKNCTGFNGTLTIPDQVESLDNECFANCSHLTAAVIGESVRWPYASAFYACTDIASLRFSGTSPAACSETWLTSMPSLASFEVPLGSYAAYMAFLCDHLPDWLHIDETGADAFVVNNGILTAYHGDGGAVVVPDSVTGIGPYAFARATHVTGVSLPSALTSVDNFAFYGCTGLSALPMLPANLESIGRYAFSGCTGLVGALALPDSLLSIGQYAFASCTGLTSVSFGSQLTTIGDYALSGCTSIGGSLVIPQTVSYIGSYAFHNCSGFTGTLTLPDDLNYLFSGTFLGCTGFTGELVLPNHVSLKSDCLSPLPGITSIVFPARNPVGYNYVPSGLFSGFTGVKTVFCRSASVLSGMASYLADFTALETIYVIAGCGEIYRAALPAYASMITEDCWRFAPTGLRVTDVTGKSVQLAWDATGSTSAAGYRIFRDGVQIAETTQTTYRDTNLTADTAYDYAVCVYTADNRQGYASACTATPKLPNVEQIYTPNTTLRIHLLMNQIVARVSDTGNHTPESASLFEYYDGQAWSSIGTCEKRAVSGATGAIEYTVAWNDPNLANGTYDVRFTFTDSDGESSSAQVRIEVDKSRPAKIGSVAAVGDTNAIALSWITATELRTTRYRIYRKAEDETDFTLLATVNSRSTLSYHDAAVAEGVTYTYYVTGLNTDGVEGDPSDTASVKPGTDTEPPVVSALSITNNSRINGGRQLIATVTDNVRVVSTLFEISLDGGETWSELSTSTSNYRPSCTLYTPNYRDGAIQIRITSSDIRANTSTPLIYGYFIDNTGPSQITGLAYESTATTVTLSWNDVSDDDIHHFLVEKRNDYGSFETYRAVYGTLGVNLHGLVPATAYTYRVAGYDTVGNRGVVSDPITVTTLPDEAAPVVTSISPKSGYYNSTIPIAITMQDNYGVASAEIVISRDRLRWSLVQSWSWNADNVSTARSMQYALPLSEIAEGVLYVAARGSDYAGNVAAMTDDAPFVSLIVDKTAPAVPAGVTALGYGGYLEVRWTQGAESDLNGYNIYRADSADGPFMLLQEGLLQVNCIDQSVAPGETKYYQVAARDLAGNESARSAVVSASAVTDTEAPVLQSLLPASGAVFGPEYNSVLVAATDNSRLDFVKIEYRKSGDTEYTQLARIADINAAAWNDRVALPLTNCIDGDAVDIRVSAEDVYGNAATVVTASYTIDKTAPAIVSASAETSDAYVALQWTGGNEADLAGYDIYRRADTETAFRRLGRRAAVAGQTAYAFNDRDIAQEAVTYIYRIVAIDAVGNTSAYTFDAIPLADRSAPIPVISCENDMEAGVEYAFDASYSTDDGGIASYLWDFGDGTTADSVKAVHAFADTGEHTVTLTLTDTRGNTAHTAKVIQVREHAMLGTLRVRVVDGMGVPLSNAGVYFDLDGASPVIRGTDYAGYAAFTSKVGRYAVGAIKGNNEYLPAKKSVVVQAGAETTLTLTLVEQPIIEGSFEIQRMTFAEIVAAGIDVTKPENQYIVNVTVALTYREEKIETSFVYNRVTEKYIPRPFEIVDDDGSTRKLTPIPIIPSGGGSGGGVEWNYETLSDMTVVILDVPVGVSALKDFFDVKLHVINNAAAEFSLLDNVFTLNVPEGLSIVESMISTGSAQINIAEIRGQTQQTLQWVLRGDAVGEYDLSASYVGTLSQFHTPVSAEFATSEPLTVLGLSGLKLDVTVADALDHGTLYYKCLLTNDGPEDVNLPRLATYGELFRTDYQRQDGITQRISEYPNVLHPGESILSWYYCLDQTRYTEKELELENAFASMGESFGMAVTVVVQPLSEIVSEIRDLRNASTLVEQIKSDTGGTQDALTFLQNDAEYWYTKYYYGINSMESMPTELDEITWNLFKTAFDGFDSDLLTKDNDRARIRRLMLDMMRISVTKQQKIGCTTYVKFFKEMNRVAGEINVDEYFGPGYEEFGDRFEAIWKKFADYDWYQSEEDLVHDHNVSTNAVIDYVLGSESYKTLSADEQALVEQKAEQALEKVCAKALGAWDLIGVPDDLAKILCDSANETIDDWWVYLQAQGMQNDCIAFLDAIMDGVGKGFWNTNQDLVYETAEELRAAIVEETTVNLNHVIKNCREDILAYIAAKAFNSALSALKGTPSALVQAILTGGKIAVWIGDNVFQQTEMLEAADNLRFIILISNAINDQVTTLYNSYDDTPESAYSLMRFICYLAEVRRVGESQYAQYQLLQALMTQRDNLHAMNAFDYTSYLSYAEWLDAQTDKILCSLMTLLKDASATSPNPATGPAVSYNYKNEQTTQSFSDIYRYRLNRGEWTTCTNAPIAVYPASAQQTLEVRRIAADPDGSENLTTRLTIASRRAFAEGSVSVTVEKSGKIRVSGLDHADLYEYALSDTTALPAQAVAIPAGSFDAVLSESFHPYLYLRTAAENTHFASLWKRYALAIPVTKVASIAVGSDRADLLPGQSMQMRASVLPEDADNRACIWSISAGEAFASVNADTGMLSATAPGVVTVRATAADESGVYGEKQITVNVPVTEIRISGAPETLAVGMTATLQATVLPDNAANSLITWSVTAGSTCLTLSSGSGNSVSVRGVSAGEATVQAIACDGSGTSCVVQISVVAYQLSISGADALTAKRSVQLTATCTPTLPDSAAVSWSLQEGDEAYATISPTGLLIAKDVLSQQVVTVTATSENALVSPAVKQIVIRPLAVGVTIWNGETQVAQTGQPVQTVPFDMHDVPTLQLTGGVLPEDAQSSVVWTCSPATLAGIDPQSGLVTFLRPGIVTVTATASDGGKATASVKLQCCYVDAATRLSASAYEPIPAIGLQAGRTAQMQVFGTDTAQPLDRTLFRYASSNDSIAAIDDNGVITAGPQSGTATLTAAMTDDPLLRKVTLRIKVIPVQTAGIRLTPARELADEAPDRVQYRDASNALHNGLSDDAAEYVVNLNNTDVLTSAYVFTITPSATDSNGDSIVNPALTYASSDASVASVRANTDGTATVTVRAKADGACTITAVSTDLARAEGCLALYVRDFTPRLAANAVTLNPKQTTGVSVPLLASYGNEVQFVRLHEYNTATRRFEETPSARLDATFAADALTVVAAEDPDNSGSRLALPNGAIKAQLYITCTRSTVGGSITDTYMLPFTVTVRNSEPAVTIKQTGKFDLFYRNSTAELAVTAKDATVTGVALASTNPAQTTFAATYDSESGTAFISYAADPQFDARGNAYKRVNVLVSLEGYAQPVQKTFTVATVASKRSLALSSAASVICTAQGQDRSVTLTVYDQTNRCTLDLDGTVDNVPATPFIDLASDLDADTVTLTLTGNVGGTANIRVQNADWAQAITLKHRITVQPAKPTTAKLGASTLKLNSVYTQVPAQTTLTTNQANSPVDSVDIVPVSTMKPAQRAEAAKLAFTYAEGQLTARIRAGEVPAKGTYSFRLTPALADGTALAALTLRVTVAATVPKVSLVTPTLQLNSLFAGYETATSAFKISPAVGYAVTGISAAPAARNRLLSDAIVFGFDAVSGCVTAKLNRPTFSGSYSYAVTPTVTDTETGQAMQLAPISCKVVVNRTSAISASVTASGKLDLLDEASFLTCTVTALRNISGTVSGVTLAGVGADQFDATLTGERNAKGQQTIRLRLKPGAFVSTKTTYKLQLMLDIDGLHGVRAVSNAVNVRVTQSALRMAVLPKLGTAYQSQNRTATVRYTLHLTTPVTAKLSEMALHTSTLGALQRSFGLRHENDIAVTISGDGRRATVDIYLQDTSKLKARMSYKIVLSVKPESIAGSDCVLPTLVSLPLKLLR